MEYWDKRFLSEGKIWGDSPSKSANIALKLFKRYNISSILVPGAGYGRNTKLFSDYGFNVVGIEISKIAYDIALHFDSKTTFINGSFLDLSLFDKKYDAIYCFNLLHLFDEANRREIIRRCENVLQSPGYIYFTVFSERETTFGKGKEIEPNTYESKPGRPTHYFTEKDLKEHFNKFTIIKTGILKEKENHGKLGAHTHILRYIFAKSTLS